MKKLLTAVAALIVSITASANFAVESGDYKVTYNQYRTIQDIYYKGVKICNGNGYNSTIVILPSIPEVKGPRFIGSGHKEGGREKVLSVDITCDGNTAPAPANGTVTGKSIKVVRISMCAELKVTYITELSAEGIKVSSQIEAVKDQPLAGIYVHQFCFSEKTASWISRMHNNAMFSGDFNSKGGFHLHRTNLRTFWFAMFIPEAKTGFSVILDEDTAMAGGCRFWDRSNSHKLYYQPGFDKVLKAGYKSIAYTMEIKGFNAESGNWKDVAAATAGE
jgi:hypothetical protein